MVEARPVPTPGEGEVLVRFRLRPINPSDYMRIAGLYAAVEVGAVAGLEGAQGLVAVGGGCAHARAAARSLAGCAEGCGLRCRELITLLLACCLSF